jgi:hypothetical protein
MLHLRLKVCTKRCFKNQWKQGADFSFPLRLLFIHFMFHFSLNIQNNVRMPHARIRQQTVVVIFFIKSLQQCYRSKTIFFGSDPESRFQVNMDPDPNFEVVSDPDSVLILLRHLLKYKFLKMYKQLDIFCKTSMLFF